MPINQLKEQIKKSGSKNITLIKLSNLILNKNNVKISKESLIKVNEILHNQTIFSYPSIDKILESPLKGKLNVTLRDKKIIESSKYFDSEKELENFIIKNKILEKQLKYDEVVENQVLLDGSRDKVDFIGTVNKERHLIEIKNTTSYYGIEQLLRYQGILDQKFSKMVLITGKEDPKLIQTFNGMQSEQRKMFEWYVYDWDGKQKLVLNKINIKYNYINNN